MRFANARSAPPALDMGSLSRSRLMLVAGVLAVGLAAIAGQILRLSLVRGESGGLHAAEPVARTFARPDIVDRDGHVIAADVGAPSLYADPSILLDVDEAVEKLVTSLPTLDAATLRKSLSDRTRRFAWIKRHLTPVEAQRVHELGLPGLAFQREPKRVYPLGTLLGHVVGRVDVDNRGVAGLERHVDETLGLEPVIGAGSSTRPPVRTTIDLGIQQALASELDAGLARYRAKAAMGLVMDVETGAILGSASLPSVDPNHIGPDDLDSIDRVQGGVYELGSIFKTITVAMGLDQGIATLAKTYDVTRPIVRDGYTIRDPHPVGRPMTVREIFLRSSNVGAGSIALEAGVPRQQMFLARLGLTGAMRTEAGPVAQPLVPGRWQELEAVTISYGHGLAVTPIQFVAAAATLLNGGYRVAPHYLEQASVPSRERIVSPETSDAIREIMRLNVTTAIGTGRRADVAGYRVGGKTGTAEMPGPKGYARKAVIASFLAAFPMDAPRYVTLVSLVEPQPAEGTRGQITASLNAAPVTANLIERIAPVLGVLPRRLNAVAVVEPEHP
ncbi:MAG: penicillin-binding protein 2 [Hyphomicrobiaceae bacterium]